MYSSMSYISVKNKYFSKLFFFVTQRHGVSEYLEIFKSKKWGESDVLIDGFGDLNSSTFLSVGDSMIYVHYLLID